MRIVLYCFLLIVSESVCAQALPEFANRGFYPVYATGNITICENDEDLVRMVSDAQQMKIEGKGNGEFKNKHSCYVHTPLFKETEEYVVYVKKVGDFQASGAKFISYQIVVPMTGVYGFTYVELSVDV